MIVSARSDLSTKLRGFDLGANDYLAKPFALDELIARVRAQLRAHGERHDGVLQAGELMLDLARRQARIGDARRSTFPTASSGFCTISSSTPARW